MTALLHPDAIDEWFTPRAMHGLASVTLDDELVLYDPVADRLHLLNPSATIVWVCCDGTGSVADIAADIAKALDVAPDDALAGVIDAVRGFAALGLLEGVAGDPVLEVQALTPGIRYLEEPPSPCLDEVGRLGWVAENSFQIGDLIVGIRSNRHDVGAILRRVLARYVIDDRAAPPNYSLFIPDPEAIVGSGPRPLARLYRSHSVVARGREPLAALNALVAWLDALADEREPELLAVRAFVVVGEQGAVLAPTQLLARLDELQGYLRRHPVSVANRPTALVDPTTLEVELRAPRLDVDADAIAEFADAFPAFGQDAPVAAPGRYPIVGWFTEASMPGPAAGMAALSHEVANGGRLGSARVLEVLAGIVRRLEPQPMHAHAARGVVAELLAPFEAA